MDELKYKDETGNRMADTSTALHVVREIQSDNKQTH